VRADRDFRPIVTERLVLRRSRPEDAPAIAAYRADPEVNRYQGWDRTDEDSIRNQIQEMAGRAPGEPGWIQLTLEERHEGALVGDVGLSPAEDTPGAVKIGYTLAPPYQGRGYATEAVRALIDYAFHTLDADLVQAYALAKNTPSIRLMERVGMHLAGRFEHHENGEVWHGVRYELERANETRTTG
jgi:RimJ/RimL family protein N-acetyltransferase